MDILAESQADFEDIQDDFEDALVDFEAAPKVDKRLSIIIKDYLCLKRQHFLE